MKIKAIYEDGRSLDLIVPINYTMSSLVAYLRAISSSRILVVALEASR